MKIGILTFHRALNYGAALQMYALSKVLSKKGHQVYIIDYRNEHIEKAYKSFPFNVFLERRNVIKSFKKFTNRVFSISILQRKRKHFDDFIASYLKVDEKASYSNADISKDYDLYIVGSDQVWNFSITGGVDETYFLHFPKNGNAVKASYAASLEKSNHKFIAENKKRYADLLSNLDLISVRENEVNDLIRPITDKKVVTVLDPTLLLSQKDYDLILEKPKAEKGYVLVYHLSANTELLLSASKIANEKGLDIIEIHARTKPFLNKGKHKQDLSPQEFLGYMKFADFIVTSSFHGTCFSIIFNRPFYVMSKSPSDRQKNLLRSLGLDDRMISTHTQVRTENIIDFTNPNVKLQALVDHSFLFIDEMLSFRK